MVMGGDSCSKGRGFKSQHCLLDRLFSHFFVIKIVMFVLIDKNQLKRGRGLPIFLKKTGSQIKSFIWAVLFTAFKYKILTFLGSLNR